MVIVVGFVPRPEGQAALTTAIAEAQLRDAKLVVVNAAQGESMVDFSVADDEELGAMRAELDASGIEWELRQPRGGKDAALDLMAVADELDASLLVIGLRHRSPVGKLVMGSHAQRILLQAACPVLAVKAKEW